MKDRRSFTPEFKRRVVEESLSGLSTPAQIIRKYSISWGLLYRWKKRYGLGKLGNPPRYELAYKERIKELECMVGRLTMDNDFLKNAISATIEQTRKRESLLPTPLPETTAASKGGAKC
ncbi:MAG: transposase [Candidatus Ratteibacteria bacterium]|jgi:transposase